MEGGVEGFMCHLIPPERISSLISVSSYIDNLPSARPLQPSLCHAQMEWQCFPHHIGFQSLNRHLTAKKRSYVDLHVYSLCYSEGGLCYLSIAEGHYPSSRSSSLGIHPFLVPSKDFFYLGPNHQTVLGQCLLYSLIP